MRIRKTIALGFLGFGFGLAIAGAASAAVTYTGTTLSYGAPGDLVNTIDAASPNLYLSVSQSFGNTPLATFRTLPGLKVINFNGAPAAQDTVNALTAQYSATGTLTMVPNNGAPSWLWGTTQSGGRSAFSGTNSYDGLNTQGGAATDWLDMGISTNESPALGVTSFGFCADPRNDTAWGHTGTITFTLSDGSTSPLYFMTGVDGSTNSLNDFFVGYTAPAGLYIVNVEADRGGGAGNSNVAMDDVSFVVSPIPEPATLSLLGLAVLVLGGRSRRR